MSRIRITEEWVNGKVEDIAYISALHNRIDTLEDALERITVESICLTIREIASTALQRAGGGE